MWGKFVCFSDSMKNVTLAVPQTREESKKKGILVFLLLVFLELKRMQVSHIHLTHDKFFVEKL